MKAAANPPTIPAAACRYPVLKCICPQHDWPAGNSTWCPSRSSSATTALPVSGNRVSVRQVTNRPILMIGTLPHASTATARVVLLVRNRPGLFCAQVQGAFRAERNDLPEWVAELNAVVVLARVEIL